MAAIKVLDVAYVRLQSPSLEEAEEFLTDFGMTRSDKVGNALYMRGTVAAHYLHVTHRGPPKVLGFGFRAADEADLKRLCGLDGASGIEHVDEPGGGKRVRLIDPLGYGVEVMSVLSSATPIPARPQRNTQTGYLGRGPRFSRLPSQVRRLAHLVLTAEAPARVRNWYRETLGFICSDEIYAGARDNVVASFDRCDRGSVPVDHHTMLITRGPRNGLNHLCLEVQSIDDVMAGHDFLIHREKYEHVAGVGRHSTSSQVFDYWKDPWGRVHEHCADTDLLDASIPAHAVDLIEVRGGQWGPELSKAFVEYSSQ